MRELGKQKPHIFFDLGVWWCENNLFMVSGDSAIDAYEVFMQELANDQH